MHVDERRRVLRLFFVFLLCQFLIPQRFAESAETLRVVVPAVVHVTEDACALSEIAEIDGPVYLTERVGALLLSVHDGAIERQQVIDALKVSGLEGVRIELKMPASVRVESGEADSKNTTAAEPATGSRELSDLIRNLASWDGDVDVEFRGTLPPGRLVSPASIVPGTPAATLKFQDRTGRERSLAVRLVWSQSVPVLTRSVKKGEPLRASDVTLRQIRVGRPGVYASRLEEVVGRSLKKNLPQGEPLPLNLITGVPIIEKGKNVIIVVRSGGLMVRAKGEALDDGALGDTVRVKNLSSKAVVSAVVVGKDTVEVKMP